MDRYQALLTAYEVLVLINRDKHLSEGISYDTITAELDMSDEEWLSLMMAIWEEVKDG